MIRLRYHAGVAGAVLLLAGCLGGEQNLQRPPAKSPPPEPARSVEPPPVSAREAVSPQAAESKIEAVPAETPPPDAQEPFTADRSNLDPDNPAYGVLQDPEEAMGHFPTDRYARIDWIRALREGTITPRADLTGTGTMETRTDELLLKSTLEMPYVKFPHQPHSEWLACDNCHPVPFVAKAGANRITMDSIMRGRDCGLCHGKVAFTIMACERCHSVPHPGSPPKWW